MSSPVPLLLCGCLSAVALLAGCTDDDSDRATAPGSTLVTAEAAFAAAAVDAGAESSTCAFKGTGRLFCWGGNDGGQLGLGYYGDSVSQPKAVLPPSGSTTPLAFSQVSTGAFHTCGVASGGTGYCWGHNDDGSLGNGSLTKNTNRPAPVRTTLRFQRIVADDHHTCGLTTTARLYCWGSNLFGELGNGSSGISAPGVVSPGLVVGGKTWVTFDAGSNYTCGIETGGNAWCWGTNQDDRLGSGMAIDSSSSPVRVAGQYPWTAITTGAFHACTLNAAGAAHCWGGNLSGQVGTGTSGGSVPIPVAVTGGKVFTRITAGVNHTCGLVGSGRAFCWGANTFGQLGLGTTGGIATKPTAVAAPMGGTSLYFKQISAGASYTCGVTKEGRTYCWGAAYSGALGVGPRTVGENTFPRPTPVRNPGT